MSPVLVPDIALKTLRRELTKLLADGLGVTVTALGANVNPPCVIIQASEPYVEAIDYTTDRASFTAILLPGGGEGAATVDALDDLIDKVRSTLSNVTPAGARFSMSIVSTPGLLEIGGQSLYGATADMYYERSLSYGNPS